MDPIIDRLLQDRAIDDERLKEGVEIAEGAGLPLLRVLLHLKLVEPKAVTAALAAVTGRAVLNLEKGRLPASPVPHFTANLCRELRVLPLAFEQGPDGPQLVLAMADPTDTGAGERAAAVIGKNVRPVLVDDDALTRAIAKRYDELMPAPPTSVDQQVLVLDDALNDPTDEVVIEISDVFGGFADGVRTGIMRAPDTVLGRNPFMESQQSDTLATTAFASARVLFVSRDAKARLRVAADLAPLVRDALVVDDLKRAVDDAEREPPDEVVVHAPKNDAGTGLLLDRLARASNQGVVVISNDASFAELPCVRRRVPLPATAAEIAVLIVDGLLS